RLILWAHVSGEHSPQVIPEQLVAHVDLALASCAHTATLPGLSGLGCIPAVAGWERVHHVVHSADRPFTVGFVGKLDFAKLRPNFVALCADPAIPADTRFIVCGTGGAEGILRRQAAQAGIATRFELRGFVPDIGRALGEMDVLGYALDD